MASMATALASVGDGDTIPLSALQHYLFCPRQCALIHVEQAWSENALTAEGRVLHEATAEIGTEKRRGVRVVTALPLMSGRLGVFGIADLVEMHRRDDGQWLPFPVEYKRGKPKSHRADEVQLCAQAMALEEMHGVTIASGALFYGQTWRRTDVAFDTGLRELTRSIAAAAQAQITAGITPLPVYEKRKCRTCSLAELCRPRAFSNSRSAADWLQRRLAEA